MARRALKPLYRAAADLRLNGYVAAHPELLDPEVIEAVDTDYQRAVEFGDLASASVAAEVAAALLSAIGDSDASVDRHLTLLRFVAGTADTAEDLERLHASALSAGARAEDVGKDIAVVECWLLAAAAQAELAQMRTGGLYPPEARLAHLSRALRHVADVGDVIAEHPVSRHAEYDTGRFAYVVATASDLALASEWPDRELLGIRALLRRVSRSAERIVTSEIVESVFADPVEAGAIRDRLVRLFNAFGN